MPNPPGSENISLPDRFHIGVQLFYQHLNTEIATLREAEFRTGLLALALDAALIATVSQEQVAAELNGLTRTVASVLSSTIVLVLIIYLFRLHSYLSVHRSMRRQIERYFNLDSSTAIDGSPLLPESWRGESRVPFSFQAAGILLPLFLLMLSVQAITLYLVWAL